MEISIRQTLMVSLIGLRVTAVERVEFIFNLSIVKGGRSSLIIFRTPNKIRADEG